jgi:hypothetical protein
MLPVVIASSASAKLIWLHMPLQLPSNDHEDEDCNWMSILVPLAVMTAVSPIFKSSMHLPPAQT